MVINRERRVPVGQKLFRCGRDARLGASLSFNCSRREVPPRIPAIDLAPAITQNAAREVAVVRNRHSEVSQNLSDFEFLGSGHAIPRHTHEHPPKHYPCYVTRPIHYQHRGNPKVVSGQSQDKPLAMQRQVVCNPKAILRQSPSNPLTILGQSDKYFCNFQADNSKANPWQSVWATMNRNNVRPRLTNKQLASKANKNMTKQNITTITPWRHQRPK